MFGFSRFLFQIISGTGRSLHPGSWGCVELGCGGGDGGVCTDAAKIQLGREQELDPAPGIKDFSSLLCGDLRHMQHKKDFSLVLVAGDAEGLGQEDLSAHDSLK